LLDFDGYLRFADKYFSDDAESRTVFLSVMTREHLWYSIINVASCIRGLKEWRPFRDKMLKFGYSPRLLAICYALSRFKPFISFAVAVKRKIVNYRGSLLVK